MNSAHHWLDIYASGRWMSRVLVFANCRDRSIGALKPQHCVEYFDFYTYSLHIGFCEVISIFSMQFDM